MLKDISDVMFDTYEKYREYFLLAQELFIEGVIDSDTYNKIGKQYVKVNLQFMQWYVATHECECRPDRITACLVCQYQETIIDYKKEHYHDYPAQ